MLKAKLCVSLSAFFIAIISYFVTNPSSISLSYTTLAVSNGCTKSKALRNRFLWKFEKHGTFTGLPEASINEEAAQE